jgi:hypothetical protein
VPPGDGELARPQALELLHKLEALPAPAQQPRRLGQAGDQQVVVEAGERPTGFHHQLLVGDEPLAVPAVEHARPEVLGVRDIVRPAGLEVVPVVGPARRDRLDLDEALAVELVDERRAVLVAVQCHTLGQAEEMPVADPPVPELLGGERLEPLELHEAVDPFVDDAVGDERVRPRAGAQAGHGQVHPAVDLEALGVLAAGRRE